MRVRVLAAAVAVAVAVGLAACSSGGGPRHIAVTMSDTMQFDPASITVTQGETVVFDVKNAGEIAHEFFIGDAAAQAEHEAEMKKMDAMGHDHPMGVNVDGGRSESLTVSFPTARTYEIGCHEHGHWDAGMRGTLTVQP